MGKSKRLLLVINLIGGVSVVSSYLVTILTYPGSLMDFWGRIPDSLIRLYSILIILSAVSYILFTAYILSINAPKPQLIWKRFGYRGFHLSYLLILIPSALWMPLTRFYLDSPSMRRWSLVEMDLRLVAVGSTLLLIQFAGIRPVKRRLFYALSLVALLVFFIQTSIIDPFFWTSGF